MEITRDGKGRVIYKIVNGKELSLMCGRSKIPEVQVLMNEKIKGLAGCEIRITITKLSETPEEPTPERQPLSREELDKRLQRIRDKMRAQQQATEGR